MTRAGRLSMIVAVALALAFAGAPVAEAGPGKTRPTLKKTSRAVRSTKGAAAKQKKKFRADRGQIAPGRAASRAKVATGDHPRSTLKGRRVDLAKLPLSEQIAVRIEELLRGPLRDGTTSLYVADAETGAPLFSVYPDDPLNPASNVKLISTAAALDLVGPDFRYTTRVLGQSPDRVGDIDGDLYLLGTYDPTLGRKAMESLAQQLVASGVRRVEGDVVVGGTPTRDGMYRSFVDLTISATAPGQPALVTMDPPTEFFQIVSDVQTVPKPRTRRQRRRLGVSVKTAWVTDAAEHKRLEIKISGTIAQGRHQVRDIWTKERAYFAAHLLRQALRDAGVEVVGDVHVAELRQYLDTSLAEGFIPVPIAEHRSKRLAEIIQRVNKRSTNWLADRVIMTTSALRYGGQPSMQKAIEAMYRWLEKRTGLTREHVVVDTGSGLSYRTELSARQVVQVLRAGFGFSDEVTTERLAEIEAAYASSLAIGGKDGTIRKRFKTLKGTVLGKTGTLSRVVSLAGVLEVAPDRKVVFAIITNGHHPRWKKRVRDGQERLVGLLCDYLHRLPRPEESTPTIEILEPLEAPPPVDETPVDPTAKDEEDGDDDKDAEPEIDPPPGAPPAATLP